jgi:hypothetical protein
MAAELRTALASLRLAPGWFLAGTPLTTDPATCDIENRVFTNPGSSTFSKDITSTQFEQGKGTVPEPPIRVTPVLGHLHYRYSQVTVSSRGSRARLVARWSRVPRAVAGDGSCRPIWFALRQAAATGRIQVFAALSGDEPSGIRLKMHATRQGPRSAPVVSETFVDGVIAAFHGHRPHLRRVAHALQLRLPGTSPSHLEELLALDWPGNLFPRSPFNVTSSYAQISPDDDRLAAGQVSITPDAHGPYVQISGELFTLQPSDFSR